MHKIPSETLGTVLFKPLEAKINEDLESLAQRVFYCVITVGSHTVETKKSKNTGKYPIWEDAVTIRPGDETLCRLEVKEVGPEDTLSLGVTEINLKETETKGRSTHWYNLQNNGTIIGEILLEVAYSAGEFPPENVLFSESKLAHDEHGEKGPHKIQQAEDPIPEEDEK